jgi:hypothetical protein
VNCIGWWRPGQTSLILDQRAVNGTNFTSFGAIGSRDSRRRQLRRTAGRQRHVAICHLLPRLGTATFVALLVAGQMLASLLADHYGFFGVIQHPVSISRLLGAALLLGGVILIRR